MSHPDSNYDPENTRKEDSHWSRKEEPSSAKHKALHIKLKSKKSLKKEGSKWNGRLMPN